MTVVATIVGGGIAYCSETEVCGGSSAHQPHAIRG